MFTIVIIISLSAYLVIGVYNSDYNILYMDILYNFNVCRAKQTEAWTYLEWFLEQLFFELGSKNLLTRPYNETLSCPMFLSALSCYSFCDIRYICLYNTSIHGLG